MRWFNVAVGCSRQWVVPQRNTAGPVIPRRSPCRSATGSAISKGALICQVTSNQRQSPLVCSRFLSRSDRATTHWRLHLWPCVDLPQLCILVRVTT